jgi:hypothetical protein
VLLTPDIRTLLLHLHRRALPSHNPVTGSQHKVCSTSGTTQSPDWKGIPSHLASSPGREQAPFILLLFRALGVHGRRRPARQSGLGVRIRLAYAKKAIQRPLSSAPRPRSAFRPPIRSLVRV